MKTTRDTPCGSRGRRSFLSRLRCAARKRGEVHPLSSSGLSGSGLATDLQLIQYLLRGTGIYGDALADRSVACLDRELRSCEAHSVRQESEKGLVGLSLNGRGAYGDLEVVSQRSFDPLGRRAGAEQNLQNGASGTLLQVRRQRHLAIFFHLCWIPAPAPLPRCRREVPDEPGERIEFWPGDSLFAVSAR